MSAIKRFFEKKKLDTKFKQAGAGHKLTEDKPRQAAPSTDKSAQQRQQQTSSAAKAGEAALARYINLHTVYVHM